MKRIAIAGFGREGQAVLRFLRRTPEYCRPARGVEIWILDKNPRLRLPLGLKGQLGEEYLAHLEKFDTIFRSPGIPYERDEFRRARRRGVTFSSATTLFFTSASRRIRTIIGITGTKGKSTVSTLLYRILRAGRRPAVLAGNIGMPMLDLLPKLKKNSIVILELSSFQLQDLAQSPHIAIVLDIFPDHQNTHRNLREYYGAKSSIARFQKKGDSVFYFPQNAISRKIAGQSRGKRIPVDQKHFTIFPLEYIKLKGEHAFMNAAMAATVAKALGVPSGTIRKSVRNFRGLPHRLEFVRTLHHNDRNIAFWNDSASSNPGAADAAVRAFRAEDYVLVAGGTDKNLDYRPLAQTLKQSPARAIVLYGENKGKLARAFKATKIKTRIVKNLPDAVWTALSIAKKIPLTRGSTGAAIVFSPGSASFDMFKNFEDRGNRFKKIVQSL